MSSPSSSAIMSSSSSSPIEKSSSSELHSKQESSQIYIVDGFIQACTHSSDMGLARLNEGSVGGGEGRDRLFEEVVGAGVGDGERGGDLADALDRVADGRMDEERPDSKGSEREKGNKREGPERVGVGGEGGELILFNLSTVTSSTFSWFGNLIRRRQRLVDVVSERYPLQKLYTQDCRLLSELLNDPAPFHPLTTSLFIPSQRQRLSTTRRRRLRDKFRHIFSNKNITKSSSNEPRRERHDPFSSSRSHREMLESEVNILKTERDG